MSTDKRSFDHYLLDVLELKLFCHDLLPRKGSVHRRTSGTGEKKVLPSIIFRFIYSEASRFTYELIFKNPRMMNYFLSVAKMKSRIFYHISIMRKVQSKSSSFGITSAPRLVTDFPYIFRWVARWMAMQRRSTQHGSITRLMRA